MKSVQNDMTVGSPMKMILSFTFPIFLGNVFQQFYNMADAVIVGKFVGTKALAAVGSTGTIMFLIYGFVVGMTAGFTVLTAQKFGAGDMQGMRRTVAGAGILSFLIGLFLTVTFMLFMKPLLHLMHTPSDIFADAYKYIMIVSGGILAQMLYNLLSSILRALGNSKIPLYFPDHQCVAEYRVGSGFNHCVSDGRTGCGNRDGSSTGHIRCTLSYLYYVEDSASSSEKGRLACWRTDLCDPVKDRTSNGIAIFYHGNWNYDGSVCPEYFGIYACGGIYCGK